MKFYAIYSDATGDYKAIKQGWSWPAFLFTWIWAMVKGVWSLSTLSTAILVISCISTFIIVSSVQQANLFLLVDLLAVYMGYLVLALSFIMGAKGNQWLANNLSTQGYQHKDVIGAETAADAIALLIKEKGKKSLMEA